MAAVCSWNHKKQKQNTVQQNAEFNHVTTGGTHVLHG